MAGQTGQSNQISDLKLKFSYWYVSHKLQLRRGLVIFLIVLSVGLFSYSIFSAVMTLFVYDQAYRDSINSLTVNLIDYQYFHEKNKPQDLEILGLDVIQGTENQYDFVVKIFNGNEKWVVRSAVAQLVNNNEVIAEKNFFVYPSEVKYVIFFNQAEANPNSSQIRIAKVGWRHYLKFADFAASRLDFEISEIEFKSPRDLNLGGKLPVSLLTFKIKNNTPYDYWQVGLYMVLLSSQKVGGANYLALEKFLSGQTRPVEMRWYESLPPVYEIEIIPEVDILNSASYMPPQP